MREEAESGRTTKLQARRGFAAAAATLALALSGGTWAGCGDDETSSAETDATNEAKSDATDATNEAKSDATDAATDATNEVKEDATDAATDATNEVKEDAGN